MKCALLVLVAVIATACGRIGFDRIRPGGGGSGDDGNGAGDDDGQRVTDSRGIDAYVSPCPVGSTAPDPLTLSGTILDYVSLSPVANATIRVALTDQGAPVASSTSNGTGAYVLNIPTGGAPITPYLTETGAALATFIAAPGRLFDADLMRPFGALTPADLASYYAAASTIQNVSAGTLMVFASDCSFNTLANVVISTTPASGAILYFDASAQPDAALTMTSSAAVAVMLNMPVGLVEISAVASGLTFSNEEVNVRIAPTITASGIYAMP